MSNKIIIRTIIIFVLAIIPPSLGMFSFYRYEDFYHMAYMKINMPDFSWDSFVQIFHLQMYEYYRPTLTFFYWIGYLISKNDHVLLHSLASLFFGLVSIQVYLIARFFGNELSSFISALLFATFGPAVAISWWTGTFAILPGLMLFLSSILFFINLSKAPRLFTGLSLGCLVLSFFTKESFIILSPIFSLLCISSPHFRARNHFIVALGLIPFALAKVYIANEIMGAGVNSHVHFNIFEIEPSIIWTNLYGYWRLLVYGHNYWFVLLALLSISPVLFRDKQKEWIFVSLVCVLVFILRVLNQAWAIDLILIMLSVFYIFYCSYYEKIWMAWIALGLSQLVFWDIPILGGLMNRLILEPSIGLALFLGSGLARQIQAVRALDLSVINPLRLFRMQYQNVLKYTFSASICAAAILGIAEEVTYLGGRQIIRDLNSWYSQGAVLKDVVGYIVNDVPPDATLIITEPPLDGMQVTDQIADALVLFDRPDISVSFIRSDSLSQSILRLHAAYQKGINIKQPAFLVSTNPLYQKSMKEDHSIDFRLSFQSAHDRFNGYIYEFGPTPQVP